MKWYAKIEFFGRFEAGKITKIVVESPFTDCEKSSLYALCAITQGKTEAAANVEEYKKGGADALRDDSMYSWPDYDLECSDTDGVSVVEEEWHGGFGPSAAIADKRYNESCGESQEPDWEESIDKAINKLVEGRDGRTEPQEGDICPECGEGTVISDDEGGLTCDSENCDWDTLDKNQSDTGSKQLAVERMFGLASSLMHEVHSLANAIKKDDDPDFNVQFTVDMRTMPALDALRDALKNLAAL